MKYQVFLYGDAAPMHLFETLADARRFARGAVAEGALYAEVYNKKDKRLNHYRLAPQRAQVAMHWFDSGGALCLPARL